MAGASGLDGRAERLDEPAERMVVGVTGRDLAVPVFAFVLGLVQDPAVVRTFLAGIGLLGRPAAPGQRPNYVTTAGFTDRSR